MRDPRRNEGGSELWHENGAGGDQHRAARVLVSEASGDERHERGVANLEQQEGQDENVKRTIAGRLAKASPFAWVRTVGRRPCLRIIDVFTANHQQGKPCWKA